MGKSTNTIIIIALLMLSGCGPTLFNVGGVLKVTTGDVAGSIVKKKILTAKPPKEQEK
jgi:dolichol kinase